jgi:anaerobic dimethyl sulfoxide reductase subunit C (anchor subunit)
MSVGSFIILGVIHFFVARKSGLQEADRMSDRALLAIGPVLVLGTIASLLHLGNPINAWRAIGNLDSSWLSREILCNVLFIGAGAVFAVMQWRKLGTASLRNAIAWVAALIGVALVISMSQVYMIRTVPAWNTISTVLSFFTTTFLLGAMAVGTAYAANYTYMQRKNESGCEAEGVQCELLRYALRGLAVASIVLVGVTFVIMPLYMGYLANESVTTRQSADIIINDHSVILGIRLALVFLGAVLLGGFLYRTASNPGRERLMINLAYAAFALVLLSELLGRYLFYASQVTSGLG